MKRLSRLVVVSLVLATAVVASATPTETLVLGGSKVDQLSPAASDAYLTWNQNSISHPKHYDAFSSTLPLGSTPVKMNRPNTSGWSGGISGNTTGAIYQEFSRGTSNLYLFDIGTQVRTDPPAGVNTIAWEWAPSISSQYIEFGRETAVFDPNKPSKVMLYNRATHATTELASAPQGCQCIWAGQVSDRFATWSVCAPLCRVWYYDIAASKVHELKDPLGLQEYSPSVDGATGTLYYIQSHNGCGAAVKLVRWTIGTPVTSAVVVSAIPSGHDVESTYVSTDLSGNDDIYFDQQKCSGTYYADIYEVSDANTATPIRIPAISSGNAAPTPGAKPRTPGGAPPAP